MKKVIAGILLVGFLLTFCTMGITANKFVASKVAHKYHYTWCKWAKRINAENLIVFNSPDQAISAGYKPCRVCKPPVKSK